MASRSLHRALALGAAISLGIACGAPAQAAFANEPALALPLDPPAIVAPALSDRATTADEAVANLEQVRALAAARDAERAAEQRDKRLDYDPALIAAIGNQSAGGHTICCPAYACAYGDAILTGQANDHGAYGCGCCTWPDWGGGNSSFRSLGSDAALLREAYDEIAAGRPTVIHVTGPYGEHWICLMGYQDVEDPDALTLDNFLALDPSNGQEVTASYRYVPYGDACEHVSDLR
ncbi:hypothetical protein [Eggerthella guodeyinii]|uniref:Peptidase C39-like domain-containing protein n=1 Tax=Eggerthella guodeyinii TaxID=2690837 RepID=A0A6N7RQY7_9ACTN|nr:hypothetical protein [Eggerthella guodeyinii]MRX83088.1 hypothetical protein [Eggerthella guodeyinii]